MNGNGFRAQAKIINPEQSHLVTYEIQYDDEEEGDLIIGNLFGPNREKFQILPYKGISEAGGVRQDSQEDSAEEDDHKDSDWVNETVDSIDAFISSTERGPVRYRKERPKSRYKEKQPKEGTGEESH